MARSEETPKPDSELRSKAKGNLTGPAAALLAGLAATGAGEAQDKNKVPDPLLLRPPHVISQAPRPRLDGFEKLLPKTQEYLLLHDRPSLSQQIKFAEKELKKGGRYYAALTAQKVDTQERVTALTNAMRYVDMIADRLTKAYERGTLFDELPELASTLDFDALERATQPPFADKTAGGKFCNGFYAPVRGWSVVGTPLKHRRENPAEVLYFSAGHCLWDAKSEELHRRFKQHPFFAVYDDKFDLAVRKTSEGELKGDSSNVPWFDETVQDDDVLGRIGIVYSKLRDGTTKVRISPVMPGVPALIGKSAERTFMFARQPQDAKIRTDDPNNIYSSGDSGSEVVVVLPQGLKMMSPALMHTEIQKGNRYSALLFHRPSVMREGIALARKYWKESERNESVVPKNRR